LRPTARIRAVTDPARKCAELIYDVFLAQHQLADMPRDQMLKSLELFGREVIPVFR
jgi:hypothetical protein